MTFPFFWAWSTLKYVKFYKYRFKTVDMGDNIIRADWCTENIRLLG